MDAKHAAEALNGNEYRDEGSNELFEQMAAAGLVAVFGYSDDGTEFRGAINDETGAPGEGIPLTPAGLLKSECDEGDDCPYFNKLYVGATKVYPKWDDGSGFSWRYVTTIPHEKFVIVEDGETYCEGIVFALADATA